MSILRRLAPRGCFTVLQQTGLPLGSSRSFPPSGLQLHALLRTISFVPSCENSSKSVSFASYHDGRGPKSGVGLRCFSSCSSTWLTARSAFPRSTEPQFFLRRWLSSSTTTDVPKKNKPSKAVAPQHEEWVAFQRKISVPGFETGQQTEVATTSRRGGRQRKKQLEVKDERFKRLGRGEFPALRYSEEETARLLAQAYANLPERAGKRGTRNLKRQGRRWFLVRKVRRLYKHHMAKFQERKMEKRSEKVRLVKQVLQDAPIQQTADRQYQADVYSTWVARVLKQSS